MICCGCRTRSSTIWKSPATSDSSTRSCPSSTGRLSRPEQDESYFQPRVSAQHGTLFEHCARALDRSLAVGSHGLPLIGTGDWNDGMNRVGHEGQGRERLAWLVPAHHALGVCAAGRCTRGAPTRRDVATARQRAQGRRSNARRGMASGIGAPTLTMGRRSAPPRTLNAVSIRSPNPGG